MAMIDQLKYKNRLSKRNIFMRKLWNVIWIFLFRPLPRGIGGQWRCFLLRSFGAKIGKGSYIHSSCKIWAPWNLVVGEYACLSENVDCYSVGIIRIGDHVAVSQGAFLCTASHDITSRSMELTYKPITLENQVWVAAQAFVGPGVTVGEGAVVGARAVVTKDVEPWTVVAGNPAQFVKKRVIRDS